MLSNVFVIPPLLTNICALTWGNMNPENCVFSVMQTSQKQYSLGLLYLRHSSTSFNNFL